MAKPEEFSKEEESSSRKCIAHRNVQRKRQQGLESASDKTLGRPNKNGPLQSDAVTFTRTPTPVPYNVPIPENSPEKIARPEQVDSNTSRVRTQSTGLENDEDERFGRKWEAVTKDILTEIVSKMNPEGSGAVESSILKTKGGGVRIEFDEKTANKSTFCEVVKGLVGEKTFVSNVEPIYSLEIRNLQCFIKKVEVKEASKRKCPHRYQFRQVNMQKNC